jgi:hypothetical protein
MEDYDVGNPHLGPRWPRRRRRRRLLHDHSAVPPSLQAFSSLYKVLLDPVDEKVRFPLHYHKIRGNAGIRHLAGDRKSVGIEG